MTVNSDDCGSKVNFNYKYISHLAGLIILCDECIILCLGGAMKTQGTETDPCGRFEATNRISYQSCGSWLHER